MGGYTKGPWAYENNWPEVRITSANGAYIVADYDTSFIEYPDDEANEANARLIAAAPELLAALVALVECDHTTNELWEAARAAISRATGEGE